MAKKMKLMVDYQCFPLWEESDGDTKNVNPDDLPLASELKSALRNWAASYERTLNQEYPPDSGFINPEQEAAFEAEGKRLWKELRVQLGSEFKVVYFSNREARLLE